MSTTSVSLQLLMSLYNAVQQQQHHLRGRTRACCISRRYVRERCLYVYHICAVSARNGNTCTPTLYMLFPPIFEILVHLPRVGFCISLVCASTSTSSALFPWRCGCLLGAWDCFRGNIHDVSMPKSIKGQRKCGIPNVSQAYDFVATVKENI